MVYHWIDDSLWYRVTHIIIFDMKTIEQSEMEQYK